MSLLDRCGVEEGYEKVKSFGCFETIRSHAKNSSLCGGSPAENFRRDGANQGQAALNVKRGASELRVGELYVQRYAPGKSMKELRKEAGRRLKYLWLGGGDGINNLRNKMLGIDSKPMAAEEIKKKNEAEADTKRARAEEQGEDVQSENSQRSRAEAETGDERSPREDYDDDEGDDTDIVPWTTGKKLKLCKEAMDLAGHDPAFKCLGNYDAEVGKDPLDLPKLIRFKCARTWLPRLTLWVNELIAAQDEHRVSVADRRKAHLECVRHCMQTTESGRFGAVEEHEEADDMIRDHMGLSHASASNANLGAAAESAVGHSTRGLGGMRGSTAMSMKLDRAAVRSKAAQNSSEAQKRLASVVKLEVKTVTAMSQHHAS